MTDADSNTEAGPKADLTRYLRTDRDSLLWKLEGLSEYDVRRPLTGSGTNLLGIVKHVAGVVIEYLGVCFGRPFDETPSWFTDDAEDNADMWATADESRDDIVGLWNQAWTHADATIDALELDTVGTVPWWPADRQQVSLHRVLVHLVAEVNRHAGHADIVRELIDGALGIRAGNDNLPDVSPDYWPAHRERLEATARQAGGQLQ